MSKPHPSINLLTTYLYLNSVNTLGITLFRGRLRCIAWKIAITSDLPAKFVASSTEVYMFNKIIKWMLKIVNRRICSVDEFRAILYKMENDARYDVDGFISIGDAIKLMIKSFRSVRNGKDE